MYRVVCPEEEELNLVCSWQDCKVRLATALQPFVCA